jgi:hypothetical protein
VFGWIKSALGLNPEERQNLTTFSVMAGEVSLLAAIALLVYVLRYSWPAKILENNASALISGLFNVVYGLLGLLAIQTAAKAAIALGGKIKATLPGGTSVEAESE